MPMHTRSRIARLCSTADAHYQCGEYALAAPAYRVALALAEESGAARPLELSSLLNNLGVVCKYLCAFEEAETAYRRSLSLAESVLDPNDPQIATLNHN